LLLSQAAHPVFPGNPVPIVPKERYLKYKTFIFEHKVHVFLLGFELMKSVPSLGKYNFCAGNYFIDVNELTSMNTQMKNKYDWFDKDMQKFPRFQLVKKPPPPTEFPMVLNSR